MLPAAIAVLCAASAWAGEVVAPIAPILAPLSPPPVVVQLRLDLAALSAPTNLALPPAAAALTPAAWSNIRSILDAAPAAAAPAAATPAAAPPAAESAPTPRGAAPIGVDALNRLKIAQEILGRFDPAEFEKLPADRRDAALEDLWDGWKRRGLVAEPAPGGENLRRFDRAILDGVDDPALTRANKSVFLGVGVLGYPLEDALWLSRTLIGDALEENRLSYPRSQRWRDDSGTPEFLGIGPRAQGLVDAWGAATEAAKEIARQVRGGSRELPESSAVSRAAAAGFARLVAELLAAGDAAAVDYLTGQDPTFTAFLLDARKPGYYLYNGDHSAVARILRTRAAAEMGIRRVDHADGATIASTYLYRPARVVERLREVAREPAPTDDEPVKRALAAYAERLAPLAAEAPAGERPTEPYSFAPPEFLPGSALQSAANLIPKGARSAARYDLPFAVSNLRPRLASGERYAQFTAERWAALELIAKSCPALAGAPGDAVVRFVSESFQTNGRMIAPTPDGTKGVVLQLSVLDDVSRLRGDPAGLARELRFLSAALAAALR